jgi:arsenite methyltransferase
MARRRAGSWRLRIRTRRTERVKTQPPPQRTSAQEALREDLREYYGRLLTRTEDLTTSACCASATARRYAAIVELIPEEVKQRNYGCGCPIPLEDLTGLTVLDLGSGAGLDCFILSRLVGPHGTVHGIDMTEEQVEVARRNLPAVMERFGYERPNIVFHEDYIETAEAIADGSIDLVISDCTINLSPRKEQVFSTIHRVLRPGGELHFSDIVADRRVPESLRRDRRLVAECLGGALYEHDLSDLLAGAGFLDAREVSRSLVEEDVGGEPIRFFSLTLRAFKFETMLDRRCEDYGQFAIYRGNCPAQPARFILDAYHVFEAGRPTAVCRNTARMLSETRLAVCFDVSPERKHFGLFPCGPPAAVSSGNAPGGGSCC